MVELGKREVVSMKNMITKSISSTPRLEDCRSHPQPQRSKPTGCFKSINKWIYIHSGYVSQVPFKSSERIALRHRPSVASCNLYVLTLMNVPLATDNTSYTMEHNVYPISQRHESTTLIMNTILSFVFSTWSTNYIEYLYLVSSSLN